METTSSPKYFLFVLALFQIFQTAKTQVIWVYTEKSQKGNFSRVSIAKCSNLPDNVAGLVNSIDTADNCARLFAGNDCTGSSVEILANAPMHHMLSAWKFENKARSVGPCRDSCDINVTGELPDQPFRIQLRNSSNEILNIDINGCTLIQTPKFYSIITNDQCVQLYNNKECEMDRFGFDRKSVELRPGTPNHLRFQEWVFPNVKAISHCAYKCMSKRSGKSSKEIGYNTTEDMTTIRYNATTIPFTRNEDTTITCYNATTDHDGAKIPNKNQQYTLFAFDTIWILVSVPLVSVAVSLLVVLIVLKKCQSRSNGIQIISEKEIHEFRNGLAFDTINDTDVAVKSLNDYSVELNAMNKPYNEAYEIPRYLINYDTKVPLGAGQFGMVFKGTIKSQQGQSSTTTATTVPVAVKMCRPGSDAQCFRSLLKEAKVMIFVGRHDHVASLVGCCTENLSKGELLLLVEYCSNGSLESYLHKNENLFQNIVYKGRIDIQKPKHVVLTISNYENFDFFQLSQWCREIARGMEFLSQAKVVHSDLATRNILLTGGLTAKVSDFGLSRQLYNYTEYVNKNQEPLPWRWMALESLKKLEFSTKSDVWSYGILCWEIFTLGEKPYSGMAWCASFISSLEDGLKLEKPKYATTEIYNLMLNCWKEDPTARPTFTEIIESLEEIHSLYL